MQTVSPLSSDAKGKFMETKPPKRQTRLPINHNVHVCVASPFGVKLLLVDEGCELLGEKPSAPVAVGQSSKQNFWVKWCLRDAFFLRNPFKSTPTVDI